PGAGPDTTATSSATPAARTDSAMSSAAGWSGASAATVGPEPETIVASAAVPVKASSTASSPENNSRAGSLRSFTSTFASAYGSPEISAVITSSGTAGCSGGSGLLRSHAAKASGVDTPCSDIASTQ